MQDKILENLEAKLKASRIENREILDKIETEYKKEYSVFLDNFENTKFKEMVWVYFSFYKLDIINMNRNINNKEIFQKAVKKASEHLILSKNNKEILSEKVSSLEKTKFSFNDIFIKQINIKLDSNYPVLESFLNSNILNNSDLLEINLSFKKTNSIVKSISSLHKDKIELLKKAFFSVNDSKERNIASFEKDFSKEIQKFPVFSSFPIVNFIWPTYNRFDFLKTKESRIDVLKRALKIALLRLARFRKSGIDIDKIMSKINSMTDIESIINLLLEFLDKIRENKSLWDDYIISNDLEDSKKILLESDTNAKKVLDLENSTIKVNELLENTEKTLEKQSLVSILSDDVDLIWKEFKKRKKINIWILSLENEILDNKEDEEDIDLETLLEKLEEEFLVLETEKRNMFLKAEFEKIDELNEKMLFLMKKTEKIKTLLWLNEEGESNDEDWDFSEITKII